MGATGNTRGRIQGNGQGLLPRGNRRRLGVALRQAVRSNEQLGLAGGTRRGNIRQALRRLQG